MIRKLASIQTIAALEPIPGADAIELARIKGWQCVVRKGEFLPGQQGVFLEIDSRPPDTPVFSFLWTPATATAAVPRPDHFRLKSIKLRGCLSQGLLMPLSAFAPLSLHACEDGTDLTELLQISKWEPELPAGGDVDGPFLSGVPRTDEERVQSAPEVLTELRGHPWVATLKCDGSSATFGIDRTTGRFTVCGRNWSLARGASALWALAGRYRIEELLTRQPGRVIQAELIGPGIQGNRLGLTEKDLRVFNVFDQTDARYLDHDEAAEWLKSHGLPMVPEIARGDAFDHSVTTLLALAEGHYPGTANEREGIVIRPLTERISATLGGRLSFKAISNRFLLKAGQ